MLGTMVKKLLELARLLGVELVILIGVDDSLGKKGKATRHLQAVDFHHNHTESTGKKQGFTIRINRAAMFGGSVLWSDLVKYEAMICLGLRDKN